MSDVTIGLPVYNGAALLERALESLTSQTFRDFTLLISDNASTDDTPAILTRWSEKDDRIKVVRQTENIGAMKNFSYVMSYANTEWMMFAAHDDQWEPNYLEELYNSAKKRPDVNLAVPKVKFIFDNGRAPMFRPDLSSGAFSTDPVKRIQSLLKQTHGTWVYGLWRRSALIEADARSTRFGHVWPADMVMLASAISQKGSIAYTDKTTLTYLAVDNSWYLYKPRRFQDQWRVYFDFRREIFKSLRASYLSPQQKILLIPAFLSYANRYAGKIRRLVKAFIASPFCKHPPMRK